MLLIYLVWAVRKKIRGLILLQLWKEVKALSQIFLLFSGVKRKSTPSRSYPQSLFPTPWKELVFFSKCLSASFPQRLLMQSDFTPFLHWLLLLFSVRLTTPFYTIYSCRTHSPTVCSLDSDCCLHFRSKMLLFHERPSVGFFSWFKWERPTSLCNTSLVGQPSEPWRFYS